MKNFTFSPLDQEYSAGVRFRIPALQECGKDSFLLYIKKNRIYNRGEGPHCFLAKKQTSSRITVRTGSTAYIVSMNEVK
jgi:hypothetical protein